jgi:hypothetical protein
MTDKLRQAAEMALNLIEVYSPEYMHGEPKKTHVNRLRHALAEPPNTRLQEREWVGLTDEELNEHARWADEHGGTFYIAYARSIEAKLKEKNRA